MKEKPQGFLVLKEKRTIIFTQSSSYSCTFHFLFSDRGNPLLYMDDTLNPSVPDSNNEGVITGRTGVLLSVRDFCTGTRPVVYCLCPFSSEPPKQWTFFRVPNRIPVPFDFLSFSDQLPSSSRRFRGSRILRRLTVLQSRW